MKILLPITFIIAIILCQPVLADSFDDFDNQIMYFYLSPSPESFKTFQSNANKFQDKLEGANGTDILVAIMIVKISQKYGWPIADGALGERAHQIIEGKSRLAEYINDDTQVDPKKLDIWWASFFATGDEKYLENIFQFAGLELPKNDINKMLLIAAAKRSFKANCKQHKFVLKFAKRKLMLSSTSKVQAEYIKKCIEFAESKETQQSAAGDVLLNSIYRMSRDEQPEAQSGEIVDKKSLSVLQ